MVFAESDIFYSDILDAKIPPPQSLSKLVTISDVSIKDKSGIGLSELSVGSTVNIESQTIVQLGSSSGKYRNSFYLLCSNQRIWKNPIC